MELLVALVAGLIAGYLIQLSDAWINRLNQTIFVSLAVLMVALGAKIGADPEVLANLGTLGFQSLLLTFLCIGGSVGAVLLIEWRWLRGFDNGDSISTAEAGNPFQLAVWIGGLLLAGVAVGFLLLEPRHLPLLGNLVTMALCLFLFVVGVDLARQTHIWREIRKMGLIVALIPFGVLAGGMLGALVGSIFLDITVPIALATGASSGFYSYAGVFIAERVGAQAGTIAFLTNFFRELLSFFIIPILGSKLKGRLAVMAPGGATTMDTTLPVITQTLGSGVAAIALINGAIVSLLVPIVVPLLLQL